MTKADAGEVTETYGPKELPPRDGVYKAKRAGLPPRSPFNWAYFGDGFWGPVVRKQGEAKLGWALDEVRINFGKKPEKRVYLWRGIVK